MWQKLCEIWILQGDYEEWAEGEEGCQKDGYLEKLQ